MKTGMLALTMAVLLAGTGAAYAGHGEGKGHGMMGEKGCPMMGMMHQTMVATTDGGVVIQAGGKLVKYDKNLNVVKEAEVKMDRKGMMDDCPMMKNMGKGEKGKQTDAAAPEKEEADHSQHH